MAQTTTRHKQDTSSPSAPTETSSHTLKAEGFDGSEDGTGRGIPVIAFGGGNTSGKHRYSRLPDSQGQRIDFDVETFAVHGTQDPDTNRELAHTLGRNHGQENAISNGMLVRRLTPVECERLQGFPDNHTLISWRGKEATECPDGPRYRAIGNSMAVPVMRWIGERIAAALPAKNLQVIMVEARHRLSRETCGKRRSSVRRSGC